jgi:hypothetical protein
LRSRTGNTPNSMTSLYTPNFLNFSA